MMGFKLEFNQEKDLLLKATRGVSFEEVIREINKGKILDDLQNKKHPNQKILVIKIKDYICAVPYVIDYKKRTIFLKTVYPSRVLSKKYLKKGIT